MDSSLKDDLKELINCSICLDTLTEPKLLPCAHRFCKTCLSQEIKRSATSGQNPTFSCPLCKRTISLPKGSSIEKWSSRFQTDRLLKDVQERLECEIEATTDVCSLHRMGLEVVCYNCSVTGCVRCAWIKHRQCSRVKNFQNEAKKIESDLRGQLLKTEKYIQVLQSHIKTVTETSAKLQENVKCLRQGIESKRSVFLLEISQLFDTFLSYRKKTTMTQEMEEHLHYVFETSLGRLNIDLKYETAVWGLYKIKERVDSSEGIKNDSVCKADKLTIFHENISKTLALSKSDMIIQGKHLLTDHEDMLSERFRNEIQRITTTTGSRCHASLNTGQDQVYFDLEDERNILWMLQDVTESADSPSRLIDDLNSISSSGRPNGSNSSSEEDVIHSDHVFSQNRHRYNHRHRKSRTLDVRDQEEQNLKQTRSNQKMKTFKAYCAYFVWFLVLFLALTWMILWSDYVFT